MARMGDKIGLGAAEAMVVQAGRNGQMKGPPDGMGDIADVALNAVNDLTGGAVTDATAQLAQLKTYLQISIAASVVAGAVSVLLFLDHRRD